MEELVVDKSRDISRAIHDIKMLIAYIEGKEFEVKDDTVPSGWISDHLVENGLYPTDRDNTYRVKLG